MNKNKIFLILLLLVSFTQVSWGSCGPDHTVKTRLEHLKMEVACSQAESVHSCQQMLNNFGPILETKSDEAQSQQCEVDGVFPTAVTARVLAKDVNKALQARGPKLVNSLEEFVEHTRLHRERVKALGLELLRSHPDLFKGLTAQQVSSILEAHDMAKVSAKSIAPDGKPFYRTLYEQGYGKRLDRGIVDALNTQDKEFMEKTMARFGLKDSPDLRAKMERIEKIADFVDRGMSNVSPEEFGRPMDKASTFMQVDEDKKLAMELEKKYHRVTEKLSYKGLSSVQRKIIANRLLLEERFAAGRSASNAMTVSARLMAHKFMTNSSKSLAKFFEVLGSKGFSRALMVLDFPMLYFADMDRIGCDGIGYHDWVKDPNCKPAVGLTPKILDFLNEDWSVQKDHLDHENSTCKVINETYAESITAPKVSNCGGRDLAMELPGGDRFNVTLNDKKQIKEIRLGSLGAHAPGPGKAETIKIGADGKVSSFCYLMSMRGGPLKQCTKSGDASNVKMNEFVKSINYQIQKGIACCSKSNPSLAKICPQ